MVVPGVRPPGRVPRGGGLGVGCGAGVGLGVVQGVLFAGYGLPGAGSPSVGLGAGWMCGVGVGLSPMGLGVLMRPKTKAGPGSTRGLRSGASTVILDWPAVDAAGAPAADVNGKPVRKVVPWAHRPAVDFSTEARVRAYHERPAW